MVEIHLHGKPVLLRDDQAIGKGGEADVYDLRNGKVVKIFKQPTHPDYEGNLHEQRCAHARIQEHQEKLPAFPQQVKGRVVKPEHLAHDAHGRVMGYEMPYLIGTEPLLRYGQPKFRAKGVSDEAVVAIFRDLYKSIHAIHDSGVVLGDFNDLNVLIRGLEAYIIDADSAQYGKWLCRLFTTTFVDPLLCDPQGTSPELIKPHGPHSDWYAYLVMLMQSLLFIHPFGGTYLPSDVAKQIPHDARPLRRITVWHPEVRYPKSKWIRPLDVLPDVLQEYLHGVFNNDGRGQPPISLLTNLQFDSNGDLRSTAKIEAAPEVLKEVMTKTVTANKVFDTAGVIVFADVQNGKPAWVYHTDDSYYREQSTQVVHGPLRPDIRVRVHGKKTILAQGGQALIFTPGTTTPERLLVDSLGTLPLIEGTAEHMLFCANGLLSRMHKLGASYGGEPIGQVLTNQTLFWASGNQGFGFYRAGSLARYFVFDPRSYGLNDNITLPPISGQIVDSTCLFGNGLIWFFLSLREQGNSINRCFLISDKGVVLAHAETREGDDSWLGEIRGKSATGKFLFSSTDAGVQRIQVNGDQLVVAKEFPDTCRFVDAKSQLLIGQDGIYVVKRKTIWRLTMN